jgi:hypothetical protein
MERKERPKRENEERKERHGKKKKEENNKKENPGKWENGLSNFLEIMIDNLYLLYY